MVMRPKKEERRHGNNAERERLMASKGRKAEVCNHCGSWFSSFLRNKRTYYPLEAERFPRTDEGRAAASKWLTRKKAEWEDRLGEDMVASIKDPHREAWLYEREVVPSEKNTIRASVGVCHDGTVGELCTRCYAVIRSPEPTAEPGHPFPHDHRVKEVGELYPIPSRPDPPAPRESGIGSDAYRD